MIGNGKNHSFMGADGILRIPVLDESALPIRVKTEVIDEKAEDIFEEEQNSALKNEIVPVNKRIERRSKLIEEYWTKRQEIKRKLGGDGVSALETVDAIFQEMVNETNSLKGSELVAIEQDDLGAAAILSTKRTDGLEKAAKVLHRSVLMKKEMGFDLDHPHVKVLIQYLFSKCRSVLESLSIDEEVIDLFFASIGEQTNEWKREVEYLIEEAGSRG